MAATQCIEESRRGEDDFLKFKPSIRDLRDFERGMVLGARRTGLSISKPDDLLGLSPNLENRRLEKRGLV